MQTFRLALACTLVLLSACQSQTPPIPLTRPVPAVPTAAAVPVLPPKLQAQARVSAEPTKPGHSVLRFSVGFQELNQRFAIQDLACESVAYARVEVSGLGMTAPLYARGADAEHLIPVAGSCGFSAIVDEVPYGPLRLIRVTLYDAARQPLSGGVLESVSPIDATVTSLELSYRQILAARLVAGLLAEGPAGEFRATQLDLAALQGFIDRLIGLSGAFPYHYAVHPTLINLLALRQSLAAAGWSSNGLDPADPALRFSPQTLAVQLLGAIPGQPLSLSLDDPLSSGLIAEGDGSHSLSGVPPGTWTLTLSGPGYISQRLSVSLNPDGSSDLGPVTMLPPAPLISGYAAGDIWSGGPLKILGSGFNATLSNHRVTIGGEAASVTGLDAEGLTLRVPSGLSGTLEAELRIGALNTPLPPLTLAVPVIAQVDPGGASIGASTDLNLSHYSPTASANTVRFGETTAAAAAIPGGLRATVPAGIWGRVPVTVQSYESARSRAIDFLVIPVVDPASGHGSAGFGLTLRGTGFAPTAAQNLVRIGGSPVAASLAAGGLQLTIPGGLYGAVPLTVQTSGGAQSAPYPLEIIPWIAPPAQSTGSFGDVLQLSGTGFDPAADKTQVTLGATRLTPTGLSNTGFEISLPDIPAGLLELRVRVGNKSSAPLSIGLRPRISSLDTNRTYQGKPALLRGSTLKIGGSNFDPASAADNLVGFGERFVAASAVTAEHQLLVEVPRDLAAGDLALRVRTHGQTSEALQVTVPPLQVHLNGGFF